MYLLSESWFQATESIEFDLKLFAFGVSVISKSELWKENYETMVDNIEKKSLFTGDFFQVTYYDVYSWGRKHLKDKYIKVILQWRTKPINDNDVNIQEIIKGPFSLEN